MVTSHGGTRGRCAFALLGALLLACSAESSSGGSPSSGSGGQTPSGGTTAMSGGESGRSGSPSAASGGTMLTAGGASSTTGGALGAGSGGTSAGSATGGIGTSAGAAGEVAGGTAGSATGGTSATTGGTAGSATGGTTAATGGTAAAAMGGTAGSSQNGGGSAGTAAGGSGGSAGTDAGKVVLFDGKNLDSWQHANGSAAGWRLVTEVAAMEVAPGTGNIITKQKLGSMFLHIEYWTPAYAANVTGQNRGNSGIYVKRAYEFQILDSFEQPIADDTCGAIYKTSKPLVSACYGAETWNTYEIEFKDSTWNGNVKSAPAEAVSVHLNGQLVQENVRLTMDPTTSGVPDAAGPQPLMLQDHDARVRYRNIWAILR